MPDYRRFYIPDAIYFVTTVTRNRRPVFRSDRHMDALFDAMRSAHDLCPFRMLAYAALWDHLHLLVRPVGEVTISQVMHSIKRGTTFRLKAMREPSESLRLWQGRFWDHVIRDQEDFNRHVDYIHYNPVKHGYVEHPEDWPRSSYRYWLERGYYEVGWGHAEPDNVAGLSFE